MTIKISDLKLTPSARRELELHARLATNDANEILRGLPYAHAGAPALEERPWISLRSVKRLVVFLDRCRRDSECRAAVDALTTCMRSSDFRHAREALDLEECLDALMLAAVRLLPDDLSRLPQDRSEHLKATLQALSPSARERFEMESSQLCRNGIHDHKTPSGRHLGPCNTFTRLLWRLDQLAETWNACSVSPQRDPQALTTKRELLDIQELTAAVINLALERAGDFEVDTP